jgi:ubiquinone/menaquinone biosynthesis C-methylase UbiE
MGRNTAQMTSVSEAPPIVRAKAAFKTIAPRVLETSPVHDAEETAAYDDIMRRYGRFFHEPFMRLLSQAAPANARVLDVGAGPGGIALELARRNPGWEIQAMDAAEDMLAHADQKARQIGLSDRVHFTKGDAENLPYSSGKFDLVYSSYLLHHLERPKNLFDEAARVIRKDGIVIIKDLLRLPVWQLRVIEGFSKYVLRYNAMQLRMCRESLNAALTLREVRLALVDSRLRDAQARAWRGFEMLISKR